MIFHEGFDSISEACPCKNITDNEHADPGDDVTVTNTNTQYVWDGKWYKDQACTEEFNFNDTMPNHDVAVYAGWNEVWYWIKIDPNGGVLTSTEATWFWESYGGIVEEYHDVYRNYEEADDGEYYYHYDEFDPDKSVGHNNRKEYTTGINYYIKGQALKLVLNYIYCHNKGLSNSHRFMVGAQIAI